jgi:hypothetical protein
MYGFWLPLWYLQYFLVNHSLSFSYFLFFPFYCVSLYLRLLVTPLVSFGHCIVCSSLNYCFWLPLWYLLAIVLYVLLWFTASGHQFGIICLLDCLSFAFRLFVTPLVSFDHCIVCSSLPYGFWLSHWYLLTIVLSVLLCLTASDYLFGIFWPLYCMFFFALRLLIISLVSFGHCIVCSSLLYGFWLSHWYLLTIVLSVLLCLTASGYLFDIFWPLYCLSFFEIGLLVTPL